MYSFVLESSAFSLLPVGSRHNLVMAFLEALTELDYAYLQANPDTPGIYDGYVCYHDQTPRRDPFTRGMKSDLWKDIPRLLETGGGACEDLASWRVAELWMQGDMGARTDVLTQEDPVTGDILYHVTVIHGNGQTEDPSALLGMHTPSPDIY